MVSLPEHLAFVLLIAEEILIVCHQDSKSPSSISFQFRKMKFRDDGLAIN